MKKIILAGILASLSFSGIALAQTATVTVPGEVRTYVLKQKSPSVKFKGDVVVGTRVPDSVQILTIPDQPDYGYVVLNDQRVVVNTKTHEVVEIVQ